MPIFYNNAATIPSVKLFIETKRESVRVIFIVRLQSQLTHLTYFASFAALIGA
jgi:hypothetical protein